MSLDHHFSKLLLNHKNVPIVISEIKCINHTSTISLPVFNGKTFSYQKNWRDKIHSHNFRKEKYNIAGRSTPYSGDCKEKLHTAKKIWSQAVGYAKQLGQLFHQASATFFLRKFYTDY